MKSFFQDYNDVRYLHESVNDIPNEYKNCSLHIALERADLKEDWKSFKTIYKVAPEFLMRHLKSTGQIFDYNYKKLSDNEQYDLFISF